MVPLDLRSTIITELQGLLGDMFFPAYRPAGSADELDPVPLNIYSQALPKIQTGNQNKYTPYIIVAPTTAKQELETEAGDATVLFHIAIFDDDPANQGMDRVFNIIETIRQDFFEKRTMDGKYFLTVPFEWAVNDDDQWPFFFGAIESHWNIPIILPTDPNL